MNREQQIEEMATAISNYADKYDWELFEFECENLAIVLHNLGYQKIDEFAECRNCTAWSGTDCTRNPYTQGCLKDENNIKRQAVKEFAEKLKKIVFEQGNPYNVPYEEFSQANVLFMVIDELLKEYEE